MPENLEQLKKLAQIFNTDKIITPQDIEAVLLAIVAILANNKKELDTLTTSSKEVFNNTLQDIECKQSLTISKIEDITKNTTEKLNNQVKEQINTSNARIEKLFAEIKSLMPKDGEDADEAAVIEAVLSQIKLPEYKEVILDDGVQIVAKINELSVTPENQIDFSHIKNVPEFTRGRAGWGLSRAVADTLYAPIGGTTSPLTTKGDLYTYSTINARLAVGTDGQALTADSTSATGLKWVTLGAGTGDMILASTQVVTGLKTFGSAGAVGKFALAGSTSGSTIVNAAAVAGSTTVTLQAVTGTLAMWQDKLSAFTATSSAELAGVISDETGSGLLVFATSPTLITPILGVAAVTSINKVAITAPATSATLTIDDGFTLHATGNVTALSGSHTGSSSGTNTGDQTTVSGNAGTVTVADAGGDTTTWVLLGTSQTGSLAPATDASLTYNATTNALTADTFIGALTGNASTATALQNARTIGGVSFDGTANITVATATGGFTVSGGNLALGTNSLTLTGSIATTGARVTKGWFTDLEVTNAIVGSITGNAATVTTNANLTGVITSVGNATSIASQTGTGTKFVVDTSPTLITPVLGVATATSITTNGENVLSTGSNIKLTVPTGDLTATGFINGDFNSGYSSSAIGDLVYLDSSSTWQKCDANTLALYNGLLAIALEVKASGAALRVALPGSFIYSTTGFPTWTIGSPIYMSETAGAMTQTQPTTTDAAIRIVGWGVHADKMYFYPSPDYITHT